MGNSVSGGSQVGGTHDAFRGAMEHFRGGYYGGTPSGPAGPGFFGGGDGEDPTKDLRKYRDSLSAATKENLFRGLARALKGIGFSDGFDADTASPKEILDALRRKLPDPRKKTTFPTEAKKQEHICKAVANALNDEFTPGARKADRLIDSSLGAVSVCRQVSELVHSMATGLNSEFLEVHASLKRVVRNLEILDEILTELHGKVTGLVNDDGLAAGDDKKFSAWNEVYARAQKERLRQMNLLKNFLSVTLGPAKEELAIAMRDTDESHDLIARLKLTPGTSEFATHLSEAVSGLGTVAAMSTRVDKALKEVGLGVETYLKSGDIAKLSDELDKHMMSSDGDKLGAFLQAASTLKENFYRRDELELGAHVGGGVAGGAYTDEKLSKLDRRISTRKRERQEILRSFINKSTHQYDALLKAIKVLGPKLGKEIPISEKMKRLRDAVSRLDHAQIGEVNLELALVGLYSTAAARKRKEQFLTGLRDVRAAVDEVMATAAYQSVSHYFAAMREAITNLIRTIDFFSDAVAKKYGAAEGGADADGAVEGGALSDEVKGLSEIARSGYDLRRSVNSFVYFFYVAQIRANLKQTSGELEHYGEKYINILGDAVADRLITIDQQEKDIIKKYTANDDGADNRPNKTDADEVKYAKRSLEFAKKQFKCKRAFYKALQALDLYMKAFAAAVAANPDDVTDIKRALDGVEVIGRWFVDATGDSLAQAFDSMGAYNAPDGTVAAPPHAAIWGPGVRGAHYYERIINSTSAGAANSQMLNVGIPQLGVPAGSPDCDRATKMVSAVYDKFQALKNIVNAFARIGNKFGGKELARQVFMSPTQIFRALMDYLKCSALSIDVTNSQPVILTNSDGSPTVPAVSTTSRLGAPRLAALANRNTVYFSSVGPGPPGRAALPLAGGPVIAAGKAGDFATEDRYFAYCVKAMAAKVMTVIGVSDLFERPSPVYDLTPTRIIIGGGDYEEIPDAIPAAAELYFRMPRLAEFYRGLLGFDTDGSDQQIAMMPEVEGVFSGLVRLVFLRSRDAYLAGVYSDYEMRSLVRELNQIFAHYKAAGNEEDACSKALSAFVMEINRRYGVVKKDEWKKMRDLLVDKRSDFEPGTRSETNYAILPDEGEFQSERRAPSDRYLTGDDASSRVKHKSKFTIDADRDWGQWKLLRKFRNKLDDAFAAVDPTEFTTLSYSSLIRQARRTMEKDKSTESRYRTATMLIQGSESLSGSDVSKTFMFHETVVVGLNVLNSIQTTLYDLRQALVDCDVKTMRADLSAWFDARIKEGDLGGAAIDRASIQVVLAAKDKYSERALELVRAEGDALAYRAGAAAGAAPGAGTYADLYSLATSAIMATAPGSAAQVANARDLFVTYAFDSELAMRRLLEITMGATALKGMVKVRFPNAASSQFAIDFSAVANLAQGLMTDVRFFLDAFRPFIAKTVFERYEGGSAVGAKTGSYFWLEANLMDDLIVGSSNDYRLDDALKRDTLDKISQRVNNTYLALIGANASSLANMTNANANAVAAALAGAGAPATAAALAAVTGPIAACLDAAGSPVESRFYEQYGHVISRIVFYDAADPNNASGVGGGADNVSAAGSFLSGLVGATRPIAPPAGGARRRGFFATGAGPMRILPPAVVPGGAIRRADALWEATTEALTDNRSLLFVFNQLVAFYLRAFIDTTTGKIYRGLIESFASGTLSQVVMGQGYALPDMFSAAGTTFGVRGDPRTGSVLCQSLALVLQRLMVDSNPTTQVSDHLVSTLSEVPQFLRESFRANLPQFVKLMSATQKQCEFVKQVLSMTQIKIERPRLVVAGGGWGIGPGFAPGVALPAAGVTVPVGPNADKIVWGVGGALRANDGDAGAYPAGSTANSLYPIYDAITGTGGVPQGNDIAADQLRLRFAGVLDSIASATYAVVNAAATVERELADEPKYLQTQNNSIEDFRVRYGKLPLMPLSLALTYLRADDGRPDTTAVGRRVPLQIAGSASFKFMYGTRGMLGTADKFDLSSAPGVRAILEAYNGASASREKIEAARYEAFVANATAGLKFFVGLKYDVGMIAPVDVATGGVLRRSVVARWGVAAPAAPGAAAVGDARARAWARNARAARVGLRVPNTAQSLVGNSAYSVEAVPNQTLSVVESSNQTESTRFITRSLSSSSNEATFGLASKRSSEQIANIIDLNLMPINVQAMMRSIPFAPLYNFAYSFEQEAALMYGESMTVIHGIEPLNQGAAANEASNTRQAFLKLLEDPYIPVNQETFGTELARTRGYQAQGLVQRIFRGDDSLMMGRPKFISDQLFNKALFGSMIPSSQDFDETGPAGAGRMEANAYNGARTLAAPGLANQVLSTRGAVDADASAMWRDAAGNVRRVAPAGARGALPANASIGVLTYLGSPDEDANGANAYQRSALKRVQLGRNAINKLAGLESAGKARFDTRIVRNLLFLTNVQRVLRLKMNQELTQYRNVLVSNHQIVNPGVTEYGSIPAMNIAGTRRARSLYAANEVASTRSYSTDRLEGTTGRR